MAYYNNYGFPNVGFQAPQQQATQTMGLIEVSSEEEVLRYPVQPGASVSFRNVNAPYIYTKTMLSQFGAPIIKKYRMIEEGAQEQQNVQYATKEELNALAAIVAEMKKEKAEG